MDYILVIWLLSCEILGPVKILKRMLIFFVYFSRPPTHLDWDCESCLIFCKLCSQCQFNFPNICYASLHLSFAYTSQGLLWDLDYSLNCSSVFKAFARLSWICTCTVWRWAWDFYLVVHRIRGSITPAFYTPRFLPDFLDLRSSFSWPPG